VDFRILNRRTHAYAHARTHIRARAHTRIHTRTGAHTYAHARTRAYIRARAHTHTRTRAHAHAYAYGRKGACIHGGQSQIPCLCDAFGCCVRTRVALCLYLHKCRSCTHMCVLCWSVSLSVCVLCLSLSVCCTVSVYLWVCVLCLSVSVCVALCLYLHKCRSCTCVCCAGLKASYSFWRFKTNLYRRPEISAKTKVRIFLTTVIPTLLFGSECWPILVRQLRRLESFQMRCLRYILGIRFATHGKVTHKSIRLRCNVRTISDQLRINRLRWLGHLARMDKSRLPLKALFSRLSGDRPPRRPFLHMEKTHHQRPCPPPSD